MPQPASDSSGKEKRSCGVTVFALFWIAFSSIFVVAGVTIAWKDKPKGDWKEHPCVIEKFEIMPDPADESLFIADLSFRYEVEGVSHVSNRLWSKKNTANDYEDISKIREPLTVAPEGFLPTPAGVTTECHVNPADPAEAFLVYEGHGQLWGGVAFAVFGGFFVLIGVFLLTGTIGGASTPRAHSVPVKNSTAGVAIIAFLIFGGGGLAVLFGFVIPKARDWAGMRSWQAVEAEVIRGRVERHSGDDGPTYSVDLFYRYPFGGREFSSNRYSVAGGSSSGYNAKQAIVAAHPPGSKLEVFVDPSKPWRAVVHRELGWGALFALFPLPFLAIGFGLPLMALKNRNKPAVVSNPIPSRAGPQLGIRTAGEAPPLSGGTWERTKVKPGCGFVAVLCFTLFWNGLISFFVVHLWHDGVKGLNVLPALFLIPFVLIGLVMIGATVYTFISLFGPVYELQVASADLAPGRSTQVRWRRTGGSGQCRKFALFLVGKEEASYQQGSSTTTAKSIFHEQQLFETTVPMAMDNGHVELRIPQDAVPTFVSKSNKIRWFLCLRVEIAKMPDIRDDREVSVRFPKAGEMP